MTLQNEMERITDDWLKIISIFLMPAQQENLVLIYH